MPASTGNNKSESNDSNGQGKNRGQGRFKKANKKNQGGSRNKGNHPKIKGDIEELGYNVYIIGSQYQADIYTMTTKAIADYVGKECGRAMRSLVNNLTETTFTEPMAPAVPASTRGSQQQINPVRMENGRLNLTGITRS